MLCRKEPDGRTPGQCCQQTGCPVMMRGDYESLRRDLAGRTMRITGRKRRRSPTGRGASCLRRPNSARLGRVDTLVFASVLASWPVRQVRSAKDPGRLALLHRMAHDFATGDK